MSKPSAPLAGLTSEEKRALLAEKLRRKASQEDHPLSYGQRAMWFLHQLAPNSPAYNILHAARIPGPLDRPALQRGLQSLVDRHAILRTTYPARQGEPRQHVHAHQAVHFEVIDTSGWGEARVTARLLADADQPFDLAIGPPLRLQLFDGGPGERILSLTIHHIAIDFWSLDVLMRELRILYASELTGIPAELPPLRADYLDYVRWQAALLSGPEGEVHWQYWKGSLAAELPVLNLPTDRPRPPVQTYGGATLGFSVDSELSQQLRSLSRAEGTTLYTTMLAAFETLLHRYTEQQEILLGSPALGRTRPELEDVVGYLINPVVLRADFHGDPSFKELLAQTRRTVLSALEHQDFPFPLLVERLHPPRDPSRSPVFQVMFIWDKVYRPDDRSLTGATRGADGPMAGLEPYVSAQRGADFDLTLTLFEVGEELSGALQYNLDLFEAETIRRMAGHFRRLLESIVADPHRKVSTLPLLTLEEERTLLMEWNETRSEYSDQACLHGLFEAQARRTPESVAVVFEGEQLTYRGLDRRAGQLAHRLRLMGAGPEVPVGLCLERGLDLVVAILGVLKAGAAYLPLDPAYPKDRLIFMLRDSRAPLILTHERFRGWFAGEPVATLSLDASGNPSEPTNERGPAATEKEAQSNVTAENLAYVIYTSGSTGKPKGVQIIHRSVVNLLQAMSRRPGLTADDTLLAVTSLSFDIAALELLLPLVVGARLVLAPQEVVSDGLHLRRTLEASGPTVMQATPATWRLLLESGWEGNPGLKILCGGEALPRALADQLLRKGAALWNLYGPTETTIWSTVHRMTSHEGPVSIGRPIANTQVYLLDSNLRPVPVGVPGELFIGGAGLARGYLDRPELTAEKFIPHPFSQEPGARLYKTGDLARYLANGEIEYLGRLDRQVKVRGYRIELGEIESALRRHPGVRDTVVVARQAEGDQSDKGLVAYVIPARGARVAGEVRSATFDEHDLLPGRPRFTLPNGMAVVHHSSFQTNAIYKEIFSDLTYLQHGVSLSDGDCVFDVGANIGLFTMFVHQAVKDARIYAFEPIPPNFELLRANVAAHGVNAKVFPFGLAASSATADFTFYPHAAGLSGMFPEGTKEFTKSIILSWLGRMTADPVGEAVAQHAEDVEGLLEEHLLQSQRYRCQLRPLSDVMHDLEIEVIDLLKIDVEKSELDVLGGIREEDWPKIRQITMEVHTEELLDAVTALLEQHGYGISVDRTVVVQESVEYVYMVYAVRAQVPTSAPKRFAVAPSVPADVSVSELRRFLHQELPAYMLPGAFVFLPELPLTPNGKVDHRALPAPDQKRPELEAPYAAPQTPAQELLTKIWAEVLGIETVGVHDSFFDLGGASIQVLQVVAKAKEVGLDLKPESFFVHQTIADLVPLVAPTESTTPPPGNTVIESLGVYLPSRILSTQEVLAGTQNKILFPLEQLTGIESRRVAGDEEFSIDLAKKAVEDCLAASKYTPKDIDLLICCNISRADGPPGHFSYEPSTSARLRSHFAFERALAFDITNACTGLFTAILLADAFLRGGLIRCGMVVSGEYISHLTQTAQKEIEGILDPRLACLTLGDAGAALILDSSPGTEVGFHELEMYTLGRFSRLCIAQATEREHGGAIMLTDSVKLTAVTIKEAVAHAAHILGRGGWSPEDIQHLIMHQTSKTSLSDAAREINSHYHRDVCRDDNVIYNLAQRGNTATTSHFVALADNIRNGRIRSGDKLVFGLTGSGLTMGTALYTVDDLPDRMRHAQDAGKPPPMGMPQAAVAVRPGAETPRVGIRAVGTLEAAARPQRNSLALATAAAENCLKASALDRNEIDLLIFTGVYRDNFLSEPAVAALLAGELRINDDLGPPDRPKTLAFDVFNGAVGFLNACYVAVQMIGIHKARKAMIATSEVENNAEAFPQELLGLNETGSAVMLEASPNRSSGFGGFVFKYYPEFLPSFVSSAEQHQGKPHLDFSRHPDLEDHYLECIPSAVEELLALEGLRLAQVSTVLPPQISSKFADRLSAKLGLARERFVDLAGEGKDYFTSSFPYGFQHAQLAGPRPGDVGLILQAGSGIQIACAIYYF